MPEARRGLLRATLWPSAILATALLARMAWVGYIRVDPARNTGALADQDFYHWSAGALAHGAGYVWPWTGTSTAAWPPGYPALLAALYKTFGIHAETAWGANIILGALTCVMLYFVGRRIAGEKAGVVAGLILAVLPGHVFFSSLIMSEVAFTFLTVTAMFFVLRAARSEGGAGTMQLIVLGIVIGIAALVRGQGLFLIAAAGLFWWAYGDGWERTLQRMVVVMLTSLAVIVPWSIRNYVQMESFVFISTNDGGDFYIGHHEGASGTIQFDGPLPGAAQDIDASLPEKEVLVSNLSMREGVEFMLTHPLQEVKLAWFKLRALYESDDVALIWAHNPGSNRTPAYRPISQLANSFYYALLSASGIGLIYWLRNRRGAAALPIALIGVFTFGQLLFFGDPRFHFPMLPSFCLLAAVGVTSIRQRCSGGNAGHANDIYDTVSLMPGVSTGQTH